VGGTGSTGKRSVCSRRLIYQLLTGRLPFEGDVEQLRYEHLNTWPTPPSVINPTLPRAIDAVVGRGMAKKPGDRYPTVSTFADAFAQAVQPAPPVPTPPAPVYLAAPPTPPEGFIVRNVPFTPPPERKMSIGMIILIAALALFVLLGAIGFALYAASNNSSQSSADATATANTNNATSTAQADSNANSTATANANTTATANTNATGTANAHATATAQTNGNANATATARANSNANATATAQANGNATATAQVQPAAAMSGNWVNANPDPNAKGITKMTITNNGLNVTVHPFSNIPTANCDWGTKSNQYTGSPFKIVFVVNCGTSSSTESLAISMQGTELSVVDNSSTNGNNTYLFNKQ